MTIRQRGRWLDIDEGQRKDGVGGVGDDGEKTGLKERKAALDGQIPERIEA